MSTEAMTWADENQTGRKQADAIIDRLRETGCPVELVRKLDPEASASGTEIGLFNRIAEKLILAA
ncbi:hypothetical protein [Erythrobacter rubeus]|uniref:Resolvase/invertase-type recombinase catalytic domain-containing protein n=1 Tax=Erythrobacter rubeus TaxID=2760803 RepID=A0ABR8KSN0_9SPHN|nr:hypothetical protein [Erythrobacter rubeus]MBD2842248.1 hypothetical protein [Erythrobacter rubeus]